MSHPDVLPRPCYVIVTIAAPFGLVRQVSHRMQFTASEQFAQALRHVPRVSTQLYITGVEIARVVEDVP